MSEWCNYIVVIYCGEPLGTYQGIIESISSDGSYITLKKPFRNGYPYSHPLVTLHIDSIQRLVIVGLYTEPEVTYSTVVITSKRGKKSLSAPTRHGFLRTTKISSSGASRPPPNTRNNSPIPEHDE